MFLSNPHEVVKPSFATHPAIGMVAVVGVADERMGEVGKAYVVLRPGRAADPALLEGLREHVKTVAGMWKYPRWIEVRDELPKTATGKIQRFKLRDEA